MSSSASKELLEFEQQGTFASESELLICSGAKAPLYRKREKIGRPDGFSFTCAAPPSQVLGKVKNFLGLMAEANRELELKLQYQNANFDIEALTGNETELIEMDLVLGVADLHTPEVIAAAEATIAGSRPNLGCSSNGQYSDIDESDSDVCLDDDESNVNVADVNDCRTKSPSNVAHRSLVTPSRANPSDKKPKIVVLD